jgi:glycerol kinase
MLHHPWCSPVTCVQADIAQVQVERPVFQETTSQGAAFAAGLAIGFYSHHQIFEGHPDERVSTFCPKQSADWASKRQESWAKAVEKSFGLADLA